MRRIVTGLLLLVVAVGCHAPDAPHTGAGRFDVFVLGIAQDGGLPHVGCSKGCCRSARKAGRRLYPACLGIHDTETGKLVLVEATPRIEPQLSRLHELSGRARSRQPVDAVLLTHAHIGHYLGLAQFGREVAGTKGLPVHVTPRLAGFLRTHGPWKQLVALDQIRPTTFALREVFSPIPGLFVTAIPVPHRDEFSDTVAFKIRGPQGTVVFVPDIDAWDRAPGLLEELIDGVDVAWLDATFYDGSELPGRDLSEIPHPPMVMTMERLAESALKRPGRFRFIHLNHTNPVLHDAALRKALERRGFRVAQPGERVRI